MIRNQISVIIIISVLFSLNVRAEFRVRHLQGKNASCMQGIKQSVQIHSELNTFQGIAGNGQIQIYSGFNHLAILDEETSVLESLNEHRIKSDEFLLCQNFPNPFNPSTTISYHLPKEARVVIKIYKSLGQEVCTLVEHVQTAGEKSVIWNGLNAAGERVSSGMYICRIQAGSQTKSMKMLLMK